MSELTGKSEEELFADLKGVIFLNPYHGNRIGEKKYLMADDYLSGNVREKLAVARKTAELYPEDYTVNVEALERVQPVDLTAAEIGVKLGSVWVPQEDVQDFMYELLGTSRWMRGQIEVKFVKMTGEWVITNKTHDRGNVKAYNTYGTSCINAYQIIEETLNLKDVRIFDYVDDGSGKKKPVLNKKETAIAQGKQEQIKRAFEEWIWRDPERRERLCKLYNEKFNSYRPREYDTGYAGLFGYVGGTIKNLGVISGTIAPASTAGSTYAAPLVGYLTGSVENCYSNAEVKVSIKNIVYAGGLIGHVDTNATVKDSYASGHVSGVSSSGFAYVGGFVASNKGTIDGCLAFGNVTAQGSNDTYSRNGGFVANNSGTLTECYRSETQTLVQYTTTGSAYCDDGTADSVTDMISYAQSNWSSTVWKYDAKYPNHK